MSTIADLRTATWGAHQQLEKRLDVKRRFATLTSYRAHLEGMWGFCTMIESTVEPLLGEVLPDVGSRRKLPLLTHDLVATGSSPADIERLGRMSSVAGCEDAAGAFGCLYVLEGATLGGRTLLPVVERKLGLTAAHGAEFLASYGAHVSSMWTAFGNALDAYCSEPSHAARARAAAVATFEALGAWLVRQHGEPKPAR